MHTLLVCSEVRLERLVLLEEGRDSGEVGAAVVVRLQLRILAARPGLHRWIGERERVCVCVLGNE